ncbi:conserved Plasmodium protein, unknown function [Plasmodium gallinaceum]|uniref:Uncharacterized protein n=1 Tax=Plasmodium gallinaceum TaxID=5849 RepID=A0A1J1GZW9_PLAGA|nr:conserved Plasmodium protein, unknown function [Plasmodium gallinaceum]CRG98004.1 conserved Plasmodium protein, unknown function [Plasmodium gallinaceum]
MFSSKHIPIIQIKRLEDVKRMIDYIENIYSGNKEKKDSPKKIFVSNQIGNLYMTNDYENIYNYWNFFHFKNKSELKENIINKKKIENLDSINCNYTDIFKFCYNENEEINIMKKNIIGIYIPLNKNIYSLKLNYFYFFKNLKELMNGKMFYEIYFILPNCIFLFTFVEFFKKLLYYEKILEYIKKKNKIERLKIRNKNILLKKVYEQKVITLKEEIKGEFERLFFNKKYTKVIYEDSIELCSFLYYFLKINAINFIDLHHLYQYIISLYGLKILNQNIYSVIFILFPNIYNNTLTYEYKIEENEKREINNYKENKLNSEENNISYIKNNNFNILNDSFCKNDHNSKIERFHVHNNNNFNDFDKLSYKVVNKNMINELEANGLNNNNNNIRKKKKKYFQFKRKILHIYNSNDNNETLIFEKQLIEILYLLPCTHKLLIKYKDLEGYNICYKMNELIKNYNLLNSFSNKYIDMKDRLSSCNAKIKRKKKDEEFNENNVCSNKLINSFCNTLNINEEITYDHKLIIGKNIYAYIYEINKTTKNIIFRFNLNSKNIIFRNIASFKDSSIYENNKKVTKHKYLIKNINNNLYLDNPCILSRNDKLFNYKNNILVGLLYNKENNFDYFYDKNVGDTILCTICDISSCGKYLYLQRYDSKNLIFHFRKKKYINLEKSYDYDDITKLNEEILKEVI